MKTEFNEEEFQKAVKIVLDYAKRINKDCIANLRSSMFPEIDLKPCKSCGRIVYVGKCCANPDYEIEIIEEKQNES